MLANVFRQKQLGVHGVTRYLSQQRVTASKRSVSTVRGSHTSLQVPGRLAVLASTTRRRLSSTASTSTNQQTSKKPASGASDVFFDNLGKIFLAGIGLLIGTLVRSYLGTSNRNRMRELMTDQASLDPLEIDDLRVANSELDLKVFQTILRDVTEAFPHQARVTYHEFVDQVKKTMKGLKGEAFTIQLGHLLDRVVLDILRDYGQTSNDPQPIALWMTVLSLALHSPVPERIQALFQVMEHTCDSKSITMRDARAMVGYLQSSHQLVPDSQVVATSQKYPIQKYAKGKPEDLFQWDGDEDDEIDIDAFADVLRSTAVCAWGECYHRKKFSG